MMKRIILLIPSLFLLNVLLSQNIASGKYIYLHVGSAIATDNLGKKIISDNKSGFGTAGYYAAAGIDIPLNNKIGFFAELNGQLIYVARKSMAAQLNQTSFYQGVYALSIPMPPGATLINAKHFPNWSVKKSDWRSAALMLGMTRKITLIEKAKLTLIIKGGMGLIYARCPELYGESISDSTSATIEQNSNKALGFSARLGLALEHQLNQKIKIKFNDDFDLSGSMTFKNITAITTTTQGSYGSPNFIITKSWVTGNLLQQINAIHLSLGIAYAL
jgi:hypothetical protein